MVTYVPKVTWESQVFLGSLRSLSVRCDEKILTAEVAESALSTRRKANPSRSLCSGGGVRGSAPPSCGTDQAVGDQAEPEIQNQAEIDVERVVPR